jgi:hypothetical protein
MEMKQKRTIGNGVGAPPLPDITPHLAMLDYLTTELARRSPMTVFFLGLARQNLLDEFEARTSGNGPPGALKAGSV